MISENDRTDAGPETAAVDQQLIVSAADLFDINDLILVATCYYLGRTTIAVDSHCQRLVKAWPVLHEYVREFIQRVVESEFKRDDSLRECKSSHLALGADCDRRSWESVRACWSR